MVLNFPSSPAAGALHNASNGLAYAFDGVKWTSQGSFNTGTVNVLKLDSIASSFNGSLKTFNLKVNNITVKPVNDQAVLISVNNVVLEPTVAYSINVNTGQITFTTAPTGGHAFFGILYSRIPVIDSITNPIQLSNGDKGDITVTNAGAVNEAFTIDAGVISTDKIADDAVTADKLANSINSAIAANTAKISNATHTGDVTGSTSLSIANDAVITSKIADDAVTSAKIAPNAITSSHIAADTVIAADIAANAITASELADNAVDTAAIVDNAVTGAKIADNLDIPDSNKIRFGTGNDLEIFHSGSNAFITNTTGFTSLKSSNGILYLSGNNTHIRSGDDGETQAVFNDNGSVDLYYDNSKKLETVTGGANVTGALGVNTTSPASTIDARAASGATITARNTGTAASIAMSVGSSTNQLVSRGINSSTARDLLFMQGNTTAVKIDTSNNFLITNDNAKLQIGAGQDLELYHDGTNSNIVNSTGNLHINADAFLLKNAANSESYIRAYNNLQVELYYDNSLKLQTTSTGIDVNGSVTADDIITAGALLHEGDTDTLVHFSAADTIDLKTSGTERLRINNSGVSLFGVLFTNGRNISLGDSGSATDDRITFGESQDLQIYHDGNNKIEAVNGYVRIAATTSSLYLDGNNIHIRSGDGGETQAKFFDNGAVELFYDNSKKLQTTSTGATVTGTVTAENLNLSSTYPSLTLEDTNHNSDYRITNNDGQFIIYDITNSAHRLNVNANGNIEIPSDSTKLQLGASQSLNIFYDGNSHIDNNNGSLKINTASGTVQINKGTTEFMAVFNVDAAVELYYDGSKKLETTSNGIDVTGTINATGNLDLPDSAGGAGGRLMLGTGDDVQIYHTGSATKFDFYTSSVEFTNSGTESLAKFNLNSSIELFHDGNKKFETLTDGVNITGTLKVNGSAISTGGLGNVVEDTSPQLGGALDTNNQNIEFGDVGSLTQNRLRFGASNDLSIFHDANSSTNFISTVGNNSCSITSERTDFKNGSNNETLASFIADGAVELYYDNSKKFETTSTGIDVTGRIFGDTISLGGTGTSFDALFQFSNNTAYSASGTNAKVAIGNADSSAATNSTGIHMFTDGNGRGIVNLNACNNSTNASADFVVQTRHSGTLSERLRITSDGNVRIPADNAKLQIGASQDLALYHTGSANHIDSVNGALAIRSDVFQVSTLDGGHKYIDIPTDEQGVELYYDNSKKFETTSFGATVQGGITFGSDTAAANQLDDYEEGTWTPSLEFGGSSTGITYSSLRGGNYTKIGRQVTVNFAFTLTSKGSATGDAHISGLPFAVADLLSGTSLESSGVSAFWNNLTTNAANIVFGATESASKINVRFTIGAEDDTDDMQENDFANNTALRGSITYFTAS